MNARRARTGVVSAAVVLATTGCAGRSVGDATSSADAFYDALAAGDGQSACARLSTTTRIALVESAGKPCSRAVLEESVGRPGEVRDEHAFGTAAQIRYAEDTVFLGRYRDGWRVTAAGCVRRPHRPYDCQIDAG